MLYLSSICTVGLPPDPFLTVYVEPSRLTTTVQPVTIIPARLRDIHFPGCILVSLSSDIRFYSTNPWPTLPIFSDYFSIIWSWNC